MKHLSDIPDFHTPPSTVTAYHVRKPQSAWLVRPSSRGDFLRRVGVAAMGIGIASLGVFPPARKAFASHAGTDPFQIKGLPCPSYADTHNCNPGCGPSPLDFNGCQSDSSSHYYGWHRGNCSSYIGFKWRYRPNECITGQTWDGWLWKHTGICGFCANTITYRCHDGKRCDSNCANCVNTVCRWQVGCT